jgi:hypothetical protein
MNSAQAVTKACLTIMLAVTMIVIPAHAAVQTNDTADIALSVFVPCAAGSAGEIVDLAGPLHTLISVTINGNNVSGIFHFQPQGIAGVGETTGQKYHATGITEESFKTAFKNGQANLTFVNNFRIIGQGAGNNFLVHETLHMTINADGSLTVTHDNFSIDCK